MDRLRIGILFGGRSEEHPISVKSAQEVATHLDLEKYEPFYIGITKSGAWKLCDGPDADWENGRCRPAVLSPDRSARGLLVLEQGRYETIGLDLVFPVLHGKLGEDGAMQGLLELSGIPYVGCDVQSSAVCMDKTLAYVVARSAGIATPSFWTVTATESIDPDRLPYPVFVKPARSGSSFGVSKVSRRRRAAERGGNRETVRLKGVDRRGCRRQRGRMRRLGQRSGSDRRRGGSDLSFSRLLQDPSGERARMRLRKLDADRSRGHLSGVALARSGDGKVHLSRPGMPGTRAGGHVPQRGWNGRSQRGQHPARPDLLQPLSEDDGGRRIAACRSDRPDGVVDVGRSQTMRYRRPTSVRLVTGAPVAFVDHPRAERPGLDQVQRDASLCASRCSPSRLAAQASPVGLGTVSPFVVLGGQTVTNTGPSVLNGDLGVAPGTALPGFGLPAVVNGATHANDAVAAQAQADLTIAYDVARRAARRARRRPHRAGPRRNDARRRRLPLHLVRPAHRHGHARRPGRPQRAVRLHGRLAADDRVRQPVALINGASPCNVYWKVDTAVLGSTTAFQGNLMALTSISLNNAATVLGRLLARNGQVSLINNVLTRPLCATARPAAADPTRHRERRADRRRRRLRRFRPSCRRMAPPAACTADHGRDPQRHGDHRRVTQRHGDPPARAASSLHRRVPRHRPRPPDQPRGVQPRRQAHRHRSNSPFTVSVHAAPGRHNVKARVTFTDATRAKTMTLRYRACAAQVLQPRRGPSPFTG